MEKTNEELIVMWRNETKRREFLSNYKAWGVFTENKELNLTFYKFDLPDKKRIIVMEHLSKVYNPKENESPYEVSTQIFLEDGRFFSARPTHESMVSARLKELKMQIKRGETCLSA